MPGLQLVPDAWCHLAQACWVSLFLICCACHSPSRLVAGYSGTGFRAPEEPDEDYDDEAAQREAEYVLPADRLDHLAALLDDARRLEPLASAIGGHVAAKAVLQAMQVRCRSCR